MRKTSLIFIFLFLFSLTFISAVPETWKYNYLSSGSEVQYGGNYSINTNFSETANKWQTNEGILDNVADIEHNWLSNLLWSVAGHIIDTDIDLNNNKITDLALATNDYDAMPYTQINDTILELTASTTYLPTSFEIETGTADGGNNIGNLSYDDNEIFIVGESTGINALTLNINFTGVDKIPDFITMSHQYVGTHTIYLEVWDYDNSSWEVYDTILQQGSLIKDAIPLIDGINHVENELVQIRFTHPSSGNPSHELQLDFINLVNGFSTITTSEHDGLSGRGDILNNHPNIVDIFYNKSEVEELIFWEVDGTETQLKTADEIDMQSKKILNLANGAASTDAVNKGQMDAGDLWEAQTATRIGLKSPYTNIRGTFDIELIGQVVAGTGDFTNLRASTFEPSSLTTSDLTIDNGGTLEIKEAVAWTSISDLWIKWDNEEIKFGAGTNGDVRQYFSGSDFYIDSRDITANDELRFTDFDEYNFDNNVVVDGKLYFENSSNGYIEWIGGTNESIGFYNSTGGFTTIEVDGVLVHSFITNLTDEEAYNLVENADDNNKSSWGECYNQKPVPDLTRPEYEYYNVELCEVELVEDCVTKDESVWIFDGEYYQRGIDETTTCEMIPNYEIELVEGYQPFVNSTGYFIGYEKVDVEKKVPLPPICINETRNRTIYPHEILSESLDLECKQVMNEKADKYRVNTETILAERFITNTTKDLETMQKINDLYDTVSSKTIPEIKEFILRGDGALEEQVLYDCKTEIGSYDISCLSHYQSSSQIFIMKKISDLENKQQAQDNCWDLNTQAEIIACMRAI